MVSPHQISLYVNGIINNLHILNGSGPREQPYLDVSEEGRSYPAKAFENNLFLFIKACYSNGIHTKHNTA